MSKPLDKLTYVDQAEAVIGKLTKKKNGDVKLSTNKIRNLLSLTTELFNMIDKRSGQLDEKLQSHVQYVRMRMVYEAGRDEDVKEFCEKSEILEHLKTVGKDVEKLLLVCHYMEALVAYHKYNTHEK